ncbi:MAG: ABC transporter ATP-binding protein [Cyanobacteria bacterium J06560_2]
MIEVDQLSKSYGSTVAIKDVTFTVEPGEILGFLGPNGAGKTTTMRILTGYLPATEGTAVVAGKDVHANSMAVRQSIGYLPETPPLYPEMTVEGFLYFVARIKGVSPGDLGDRITSAINRCNLQEKRTTIIRKLSKGFRQRVGIAQAIVHNPPVIVLDEPTVGLDPRQIIEVRNLIKSLAGEHTIILSTHILPEVSATCDRITIIKRGQIVATDSPEKLVERLTGKGGYKVELRGEVEKSLAVLSDIPGVSDAELIKTDGLAAGHARFQVTTGAEELGNAIAAQVVQSGLDLFELSRSRASLEDVFIDLTMEEETVEEKPVEEETVELNAPAIIEAEAATEGAVETADSNDLDEEGAPTEAFFNSPAETPTESTEPTESQPNKSAASEPEATT